MAPLPGPTRPYSPSQTSLHQVSKAKPHSTKSQRPKSIAPVNVPNGLNDKAVVVRAPD